jgi:hypothetical protein
MDPCSCRKGGSSGTSRWNLSQIYSRRNSIKHNIFSHYLLLTLIALHFQDYIKVIRLFCGEPVWTPINRPAEEHPSRKAYVESAKNDFKN